MDDNPEGGQVSDEMDEDGLRSWINGNDNAELANNDQEMIGGEIEAAKTAIEGNASEGQRRYHPADVLLSDFMVTLVTEDMDNISKNITDWYELGCDKNLIHYKILKPHPVSDGNKDQYEIHLVTATDVTVEFVQNMLVPTEEREARVQQEKALRNVGYVALKADEEGRRIPEECIKPIGLLAANCSNISVLPSKELVCQFDYADNIRNGDDYSKYMMNNWDMMLQEQRGTYKSKDMERYLELIMKRMSCVESDKQSACMNKEARINGYAKQFIQIKKASEEIFNLIWFNQKLGDSMEEIEKGMNRAKFWRKKSVDHCLVLRARKIRWRNWQQKLADFLDLSPDTIDNLMALLPRNQQKLYSMDRIVIVILDPKGKSGKSYFLKGY